MEGEQYGAMMDCVLKCHKAAWGGGGGEVRENETDRYEQASREVARCAEGGALASWSVSSYLGRSGWTDTIAQKHTDVFYLRRCAVSYWHCRATRAAHTVSQLDRRPGSGTPRLAGCLGCWNTAFITLMH